MLRAFINPKCMLDRLSRPRQVLTGAINCLQQILVISMRESCIKYQPDTAAFEVLLLTEAGTTLPDGMALLFVLFIINIS